MMDWLKLAGAYEQAMISDIQRLVDIPSLLDEKSKKPQAPFGLKLREVLDTALAIGQRDGFKIKDIDGYAGVIELGDAAEAVGMLGHLDVVPVSDGWTKEPFKSVVENGIIFGRGSADDKGPTMAAYYAMRILKDQGIKLNKRIQLIMGCDEETGMRCMDYFRQQEDIPQCGFVPDAVFPVVYAEKGILDLRLSSKVQTVIKQFAAGQRPNIVIAQATALVAGDVQEILFDFYLRSNELTGEIKTDAQGVHYSISGIGAHGARPYLGVNAAWHLLNFIGSAYQDEFAQKTAYFLKDWMASRLNNRIDGVYLGFLTMNLGVVAINNGQADLTLDIRYPNELTSAVIIDRITKVFAAYDYPCTISVLSDLAPLFVNPQSALIKTLEQSYRLLTGDQFTPLRIMSGGTYARKLKNFVAYGAGMPNNALPAGVGIAHENDEGVMVKSLVQACAIYAEALFQLTR
ncbi:MAG: Sapep family Mn(2+)-dependent dipeptidase [Erysipelotrichaceae bacterium]|nr:Sapep family Mn(2+)-dependent dipeptidase [Erysipelotrichaceae bacterium]